jgi:HEAT repeat protein
VCEEHGAEVEALEGEKVPKAANSIVDRFWRDPKLIDAVTDPVARRILARIIIPGLCTALRHAQPNVRVQAAADLARLGAAAASALPGLREAQHDPEGVVRKAVAAAIETIEGGKPSGP